MEKRAISHRKDHHWRLRLGMQSLYYHAAYQSDVGMKRVANQDVAEVFAFDGGILSVVCDGMGGTKGGEIASRLAADTILNYFKQLPMYSLREPFARLAEAIQWANRKIWEMAQQHPDINKMGTTVVAALCYRGAVYVAHVGDSRLYLLRNNTLLRVTKDHSRNQRLVDEGKLTAEEAEGMPGANLISRVLGQFADVEVECQPAPITLQGGDRLLLCSDGLVRMLSEEEVLLRLGEEDAPEQICRNLIEMANHAGGKDNTTVQVVTCQAAPQLWNMTGYAIAFLTFLLLLLWFAVSPAPRSVAATLDASTTNTQPQQAPAPDGALSSQKGQPSSTSPLDAPLDGGAGPASLAPPLPTFPQRELPVTKKPRIRRRRRRKRRYRRRRRRRRRRARRRRRRKRRYRRRRRRRRRYRRRRRRRRRSRRYKRRRARKRRPRRR